MKLTLCVDRQSRATPSTDLREYQIEIGCPLRSYEDVFDELKIVTDDDKKLIGTIIRRCEVNKYGVLLKLEQEKIQELVLPGIALFEGDNYVYIKEYNDLNMKIQYLTNAEMNKYFALKSEMNSTIQQTIDSLLLKVFRKDDIAELISEINMSPEKIKIKSGKIELEGYTTINGGFSIDENGSPIIRNGSILITDDVADTNESNFEIVCSDKSRVNLKPKYLHMWNSPEKAGFIVGLNYFANLSIYMNGCGPSFTVNPSGQVTFSLLDASGMLIRSDMNGTEIKKLKVLEDIELADGSILNSSDKRLKKHVKEVNVSWLNELKIREFEYKKTPNRKMIGLIAQDYLDKNYSKYFLHKNEDGYYSINYQNITNALIQYCQELEKRIADLERRCNNE